jgi:DNA-binding transcriptional MerR regulator
VGDLHKLYYRIGEVSKIVGVEPYVLRHWEQQFRSVRPTKSPKGHRVYTKRDVQTLLRVKHLVHEQKFTLAGARKRLREQGVEEDDGGGAALSKATIETLRAVRAEAIEVLALLDRADADLRR